MACLMNLLFAKKNHPDLHTSPLIQDKNVSMTLGSTITAFYLLKTTLNVLNTPVI